MGMVDRTLLKFDVEEVRLRHGFHVCTYKIGKHIKWIVAVVGRLLKKQKRNCIYNLKVSNSGSCINCRTGCLWGAFSLFLGVCVATKKFFDGKLEIIDVNSLAKKLDIHKVTLLRKIRQGKLCAQRIGRSYWVSKDALKAFLDDGLQSNIRNQNKQCLIFYVVSFRLYKSFLF